MNKKIVSALMLVPFLISMLMLQFNSSGARERARIFVSICVGC